ncbi:hypothetical protein SLU01_06380 [Sporosarcina luteola]|uniref:G5 domain-containing protein n=1 Tax=Sporosarcina luteola TaxID=582850 RepID=A0A511Z4G0_9BACL|nr:VanW family protein [Sporosarcina luteola]GEN82326.1 hypothetical protein SLU01_06380 [Sporosarcina luteola]
MKNKHYFSTYLLVIIVILAFTVTNKAFANNVLFINNKAKFGDHTFIGPFNISNEKTREAKSKLIADLSDLQSKLDVNLIYQDIQFSLIPETITFDIDKSLANVNSGQDNPIIASVSRGGLNTVLTQQLPQFLFTEETVDLIAEGVEKELQTGIMPRNIHITDYLPANEIPIVEVALSEYNISGTSGPFKNAIQALDKSVVQPLEMFSMMELLTSSEIGMLSDEEMSLLSSMLYTAVLQTNFQIDERNISTLLSPIIHPGYEAAMNQTLGLDFKFTNPNKSDFTIHANWSNGKIQLSIEGPPFYYSYEPVIERIDTYKPRTVRQYSAFVNDGQVIVSQEGKEGMEVVVRRNISLNGKVINTEDVSKDFYAPIHRIEMLPLTKADASTGESTGGSDVGNESFENDEVQFDDGESNTETDPSTGNGTGQATESGTTTTGTESQNEGKQIYDKSGMPIGGK